MFLSVVLGSFLAYLLGVINVNELSLSNCARATGYASRETMAWGFLYGE